MFRTTWTTTVLLLAALLVSAAGCGSAAPPDSNASPSATGKHYLLNSEPASAKDVIAARAAAKEGDEVTVVGRIGGDANPWVEGQAAFLVVDCSLKPCSEQADDGCPTPWDYCCDTDALPTSKAMVKVVDASGKTVATDARKLLGLKELQTVVVHGRAKRDEAGNLTVLTESLFVRN